MFYWQKTVFGSASNWVETVEKAFVAAAVVFATCMSLA